MKHTPAPATAVVGRPSAAPAPLTEPRRAYRGTDDRWLGGVASGLALHLGLPVLWVRMGFLVMVAFGGFGAVLYAGLWLFLPARRHTPDPGSRRWTPPPGRASARVGRSVGWRTTDPSSLWAPSPWASCSR